MADELGIGLPGGDETDIDITPGDGIGVVIGPVTPTDPIIPITPQEFRPTFPGPIAPPAPVPPPEPAPPPEPVPVPEPVGPLGGLPDLGWLAILLVLLGLIGLAAALVEFFNWLLRAALRPIPGGSKVSTFTTTILAQPLSNALGNAYTGIDSQIGLSFTTMGQTANRVGLAILANEQAAYIAAVKLAALAGNTTGIHTKAVAALQRSRQAQITASEATRKTTVETQRAVTIERGSATKANEQQQHITHLIEPELDSLRHRIHQLERGATTTWGEVLKHEELLGIGAMTATTAVALGRLGADWTMCEANKILGKANCGNGANNLKRLLEGLIDIAGLLALCPLTELLYATAESAPVQDALKAVVEGGEALLHCRGIATYTPPAVAAPSLSPTVFPYAALAPVV